MQAAPPDLPSLLLVEDDLVFCNALARSLEARGYSVQKAYTGAAAIDAVEANAPEFAVVDLRLPDMSGLKVVQRLAQADEHTRVVVLTGYGSIATAIDAVKQGAVYYLTKPVNADQVIAAFDKRDGNVDVPPAGRPLSVDRMEWEHIQRVLTSVDGNVSAAARLLHMHRRSLQRKLNKFPPRS
jgi:two-component system, response regulator RegA